MSYQASGIECDWCLKEISNGASVACFKCHEELEAKVFDLGQENDRLKDKIAELEAERPAK